jgi:hypothetical protein
MALQKNLALLEWAMMAVGLAGAAIDDLGAILAFAIGIDASVEGVLQHRNYIAIADRCPVKRDQLPTVRRAREMDFIGPHRQMNLTSGSKLAEAIEDEANSLLYPQVRIKAQPDLAVPDVADWNRDPQFPPPGLRTSRVQHPRAQNAQLELTDAALHAQEQPVVRTTRVVNAVKIDHSRLDESAKLKQMMPIAAIAGEARCVETQNRTDVSGAQPSYKLLKTRAGHGSACGPTQIVIDHLNVAKSASPRFIDEFILSTLAL